MSWSSKALPWLIPSLFLTAPLNGTIIVVSPWLEDVNLQISRWEGNTVIEGTVPFTDVILWLHQECHVHFIFYVRANQLTPTMNRRLVAINRKVSELIEFVGIQDLHAKMLVTDTIVLETSANLLTNSLYRNVETVMVQPNPNSDAKTFTRNFFTRHGLLLT